MSISLCPATHPSDVEVQAAGLVVGVAVLDKIVQADFVKGATVEGRVVVLVHLEGADA